MEKSKIIAIILIVLAGYITFKIAKKMLKFFLLLIIAGILVAVYFLHKSGLV